MERLGLDAPVAALVPTIPTESLVTALPVYEQLSLAPIGLRAANAFVDKVHRHHDSTRGHKFSIAVLDETGELRAVAIAGRPIARMLDDGSRLELLRLASDGVPNACSMLYGAVARAGVAMGYKRENIFTYILDSEDGTSLRAAGWVPVSISGGGPWSRPSRARDDAGPLEPKERWHAAPLTAPVVGVNTGMPPAVDGCDVRTPITPIPSGPES